MKWQKVAVTSQSWSPDGTRIAFSARPAPREDFAIYVMNADGSNLQRIAEGSSPRWSPDGSRIAFTERISNSGVEVLVINANGSGPDQSFRVFASASVNAEAGRTWVPDAIIAPVNRKAMELAVIAPKRLLHDGVERSQMRGCWHEHAPPDHQADTAQPEAELGDSLGWVRETGHHRALRVRVLGIGLS